MATYHCTFKHGAVTHAIPHQNYICREGKYGTQRMKEQLVYKESGNLPAFANGNAKAYWQAADEHTRINGRAYEEFELALPQELTHEENIELVKAFIAREIGDKHAYTFAIHDKAAANDPQQRQIHAHIMYSSKLQDGIERSAEQFFKRYNSKHPERGGAENDTRFSGSHGSDELIAVRERWEKMVNQAYRERGIDKTVSCKSLAVQYAEALVAGDKDKALILDRAPQVHMGAKLTYSTQREAAKHIDKEKFYLEKAHPKARHNFLARQQKEIAEQIVMLRRERILTLRENLENKAKIRDTREAFAEKVLQGTLDEKREAANELKQALQEQMELNAAELESAKNELQQFRAEKANWLLSDKKIMQIANDIYTKGATKKLRQEGQKLKAIAAKNEALEQKINLAEKDGTRTPEEIRAGRQKLQHNRQLYAAKKQDLLQRVADMQRRLSAPKAKEATQEIQAAIRQRVELSRQRIADRQQRIQNLRTQNFALRAGLDNLKEMTWFNNDRQRLIAIADRYSQDLEKLRLLPPKERMTLLRAELAEISIMQRQTATKIRRLPRFHINEAYALNAAKSVYTHGAYKKFLRLGDDIRKLEQYIATDPEGSEKKELLKHLRTQYAEQQDKLAKTLSTDHARQSIARMVENRIDKNAVLEARQTILSEFADELKNEQEELQSLKEETAQELAKLRANERPSKAVDTQTLLNQLRGLLSMPEVHARSGLTASIRDDRLQVKDKTLRQRGGGYGDW